MHNKLSFNAVYVLLLDNNIAFIPHRIGLRYVRIEDYLVASLGCNLFHVGKWPANVHNG